VPGDDDHTPFPGCRTDRGFLCDLRLDGGLEELISSHEHREILGIEKKRERFERFLFLLEQKVRLLAERDTEGLRRPGLAGRPLREVPFD